MSPALAGRVSPIRPILGTQSPPPKIQNIGLDKFVPILQNASVARLAAWNEKRAGSSQYKVI